MSVTIESIKLNHNEKNNSVEILSGWTPPEETEVFLKWIPNNVILFIEENNIISEKMPDSKIVKLVNNPGYRDIKIEKIGFAGSYSYRIFTGGEDKSAIKEGIFKFGKKFVVKVGLYSYPYGKRRDKILQLVIKSDYYFPIDLLKLRFCFKNANANLEFPLPEMNFNKREKKYVSVCYVSSDYKKYGIYEIMLTNDIFKDYIEIENHT